MRGAGVVPPTPAEGAKVPPPRPARRPDPAQHPQPAAPRRAEGGRPGGRGTGAAGAWRGRKRAPSLYLQQVAVAPGEKESARLSRREGQPQGVRPRLPLAGSPPPPPSWAHPGAPEKQEAGAPQPGARRGTVRACAPPLPASPDSARACALRASRGRSGGPEGTGSALSGREVGAGGRAAAEGWGGVKRRAEEAGRHAPRSGRAGRSRGRRRGGGKISRRPGNRSTHASAGALAGGGGGGETARKGGAGGFDGEERKRFPGRGGTHVKGAGFEIEARGLALGEAARGCVLFCFVFSSFSH